MSSLFLIFAGIALMLNHSFFMGIVCLLIGCAASRETAKMAAIITGILLIASSGWLIVGVIGLVIGLCDSKR